MTAWGSRAAALKTPGGTVRLPSNTLLKCKHPAAAAGQPASLTVINHSSLSVRKVLKMGCLGEPIVLDAASCSSSSITSSS